MGVSYDEYPATFSIRLRQPATPITIQDMALAMHRRRSLVAVVALGLVAPASAGFGFAGSALATAPSISCVATMSNAHPSHNQTTIVQIRTSAGAHVSAVAHYKTKATSHAALANAHGAAAVPFDISMATVGYRVVVNGAGSVGSRSGHCATSFTPVERK